MAEKTQRLNQVIAIEKGIKSKVNSDVTELYKVAQKPALFEGQARTYTPSEEGGEVYPSEQTRVQAKTTELLRQTANHLSKLFDVTAAKDYANCTARADIVVDDQVLVKDAPATYLLFLEKQLTDLYTMVSALPVLDPAFDWSYDKNSELFKTEPTKAVRTKKVQRPIVMYDATEHHPAQTQLITEDVSVGTWSQTRLSGAMPTPHRTQLLAKIEKLQQAVKYAREYANSTNAPTLEVGEKVFTWLLA